MKKYHINIVRRDFMGQTRDDYHATVTRLSDGLELVWISDWRWLLNWKTRRAALDRAFKSYEKHQAKLSEVKEIFR